ncbi:MAG: hypothetical protein WA777_16300 [Rhodanobacter sp.]
MSNPSLGDILRVREAAITASCLVELEKQAAEKGPCAVADLQLVKDFFHEAMTQFTNSILGHIEIRPLLLGKGKNEKVASILQTFRWKGSFDIRDSSHPYHAVWVPFQAWCDENGLRPEIGVNCMYTVGGGEQWHALTVKSTTSA